MKKNYTFLFILSGLTCPAQVTLTPATHGLIPGYSQTVYDADTALYTPGSAGTAQTWDFSGLTYNGFTSTTEYVDPALTVYGFMFPGSTVAEDDGTGSFTYYALSAADLTDLGGADPSFAMTYTNPETVMKYPFAYSNWNADSFSGSYSGISISGNMIVAADAYGTLLLPSGSYNTLRVKSQEHYTISYSTGSVTVDVTAYSWYTATDRSPVMQYLTGTESGSVTNYDKYITVNAEVVGISEAHKDDAFLSVYPNPAHGSCTVNYSLDASAAVSVTITDISGREIMNVSKGIQPAGSRSETIDLSSVAAGSYIVKLNYGNGIAYKKIQVE